MFIVVASLSAHNGGRTAAQHRPPWASNFSGRPVRSPEPEPWKLECSLHLVVVAHQMHANSCSRNILGPAVTSGTVPVTRCTPPVRRGFFLFGWRSSRPPHPLLVGAHWGSLGLVGGAGGHSAEVGTHSKSIGAVPTKCSKF